MQTTSYGGTAMAPSPSSPGVVGLMPSSLHGEQHEPVLASTPLVDEADNRTEILEGDIAADEDHGPTSSEGNLDHDNLGSASRPLATIDEPEGLSTSPPDTDSTAGSNGTPASSYASETSDATLLYDQDDNRTFAPPANGSLSDSHNTESRTEGRDAVQQLDPAPASEEVDLGAVSADLSSADPGTDSSFGTISPSTGASVAASLQPTPRSVPPPSSSSLPAVSATPPPPSHSAADQGAGAADANQRLVYPALHLFPLNGTFVPKCINLSPPGPHNRVKIGRQTTAKTAPNPTNGYFDSKVLSRAHAEIWSRDGKIYIKDVKSSNGTFINGERISAEAQESDDYELHSEDHVEFGIDIVSEDGKAVMHHKVACRVYVVITAEDAMQIRQDITNGYIGGAPSLGARGGNQGTMAGAGGLGGAGGYDTGAVGQRGGLGGPGGKAGSMINLDHVLTRLQSELKRSREAGQELDTISNVFSDIHDTLAGGLPPLQQAPYQHLVPSTGAKESGAQEGAAGNASTAADAEAAAAAAAKAASDAAAAAAALKAKQEAEAKLAATKAQAAEQAQTVNQLQAQLSETQASLAEHIAKMRGLEQVLVEHENLKGEVDALRRLVADVETSSSSAKETSINGPHALGRVPPPPLPPLPSDAAAPPPALFGSTAPLPPPSSNSYPSARFDSNIGGPIRSSGEPELELFDAFKARTNRKTPAMLAEEEERMRVLDQREREAEQERRQLLLAGGEAEGELSQRRELEQFQEEDREGDEGLVDPLLRREGRGKLPSHDATRGEEGEGADFDDGASVASVDTVVPGSPPAAPAPRSLRLEDDDSDAPLSARHRKREESSPGLLHVRLPDANAGASSSAPRGRVDEWTWRSNGGRAAGADQEDDEDEYGDEVRKNGHVGPLAPPDMPAGMSYDGLDHQEGNAWSKDANGRLSASRMTRAQLLEENAKLQARLTSLEQLLSEALALGRSLSQEIQAGSRTGAAAGKDSVDSLLDIDEDGPSAGEGSHRAVKIEATDDDDSKEAVPSTQSRIPSVKSEEESSESRSSLVKSEAEVKSERNVDAYVRHLESRIATLESEMDRRVAEVESEILRETQAKWELWRAQAESSWERDHGRIFRKVVEQQQQQQQQKAAADAGKAASSSSAAGGDDNDVDREEERSARSASSGGTGDTELSSSSSSSASTNATSPPSSIAESVGRFGKSLLGGQASSSAGGGAAASLRSVSAKDAEGRTQSDDAANAGNKEDEKRLGAAPPKPFLFSDNSATVPALSAAGAVIVAMAVMAFAAKSAGPHK